MEAILSRDGRFWTQNSLYLLSFLGFDPDKSYKPGAASDQEMFKAATAARETVVCKSTDRELCAMMWRVRIIGLKYGVELVEIPANANDQEDMELPRLEIGRHLFFDWRRADKQAETLQQSCAEAHELLSLASEEVTKALPSGSREWFSLDGYAGACLVRPGKTMYLKEDGDLVCVNEAIYNGAPCYLHRPERADHFVSTERLLGAEMHDKWVGRFFWSEGTKCTIEGVREGHPMGVGGAELAWVHVSSDKGHDVVTMEQIESAFWFDDEPGGLYTYTTFNWGTRDDALATMEARDRDLRSLDQC